ncbi:hypothetical protein HK102_008301 [Quaeritorhiza haematococci]|nr:hypothetical protein HK102_008301 [Quaeritorhiza haematococci]
MEGQEEGEGLNYVQEQQSDGIGAKKSQEKRKRRRFRKRLSEDKKGGWRIIARVPVSELDQWYAKTPHNFTVHHERSTCAAVVKYGTVKVGPRGSDQNIWANPPQLSWAPHLSEEEKAKLVEIYAHNLSEAVIWQNKYEHPDPPMSERKLYSAKQIRDMKIAAKIPHMTASDIKTDVSSTELLDNGAGQSQQQDRDTPEAIDILVQKFEDRAFSYADLNHHS